MRVVDHREVKENQEIVALRERLVKDARVAAAHAKQLNAAAAKANGKGKQPEQQHATTTPPQSTTQAAQDDSGPLDMARAIELVLDTLALAASTSTSPENAHATTVLAYDTLTLLLTRCVTQFRNGEAGLIVAVFDSPMLLRLADASYFSYDSGPSVLLAKIRSALVSLLDLAEVLETRIVFEHLRAKIAVAPWTVKRTLNTFDVLITRKSTTLEDMAAFKPRPDEPTPSGIVRRFAEGMAVSDEMAYPAGRVVTNWNNKVWALEGQDPTFWIQPSLDVLQSASRAARTNLCLYLFPGIFEQQRAGLKEILQRGRYLHEENQKTEDELHILLALLKVGHQLHLVEIAEEAHVEDIQSTDRDPHLVVVPQQLIQKCLYHASASLRTSAFALLVLSTSNHLAIPASNFPLIRTFYNYSLGDEDGEFRMTSIALSGKLLLRLRDSAWKAQRKVDKLADPASIQYVVLVQSFITWWTNDLLANLNPAKPFRIRTNALRFLDLLLQAKLDERFGSTIPLVEGKSTGPKHVSGYSSYRKTAPTTMPHFQRKHKKIDDDAASGKADDGTSPGAWPFRVDLINAKTTFTLLRLLLSTYTSLRELSIVLLERFPAPLPGYEGQKGGERAKKELLVPALRMVRSGRESEASAGAGIVGLVWRKWVLEGEGSWKLGEIGGWTEREGGIAGAPGFAFLNSLMDLADAQLAAHEADLGRAASTSPMHGTLIALRHLFISIPLASLDRLSSVEERRALFHRALAILERVWSVTSPVLAASAPEGVTESQKAAAEAMVTDTEEARALRFEGDDVEMEGPEDLADGVGGPMHKVILSATWRAMKEAGELLETILRLPSELGADPFRSIWSFEEIQHIGSLFATWLARIRHRGAFMALHPCYSRAAAALLQCKDWPEVKALPAAWLRMHLDSIVSQKISITRRSAGIPYCIVGILNVVLSADRPTFDAAFVRLFDVAESTSSEILDESRVHAMNTLRTAFLDSKLTPGVAPYIERGFLISISLFWSSNWICRNVAMMTYAALVTRAFTPRRINLARDHASLQIRMSTADFFGRFPSLHGVLKTELERSTKDNLDDLPTSDLHSSLFSVLMLLSLLQSPNQVGSSNDALADPFIKIVRACATSRVWKIRDAAGDALTGLVQARAVASVCIDLLVGIDTLGENETHGRLVQFLRLLEAAAPLSHEDGSTVFSRVVKLAPVLLARHHSFSVRTAYLNIVRVCALSHGQKSNVLLDLAHEELDSTRSWGQSVAHLPSAENFVAAAFSVVLVYEPSQPNLLIGGLAAPFLEVQRLAFKYLKAHALLHTKVLPSVLDVALSETAASECRIWAIEILTSAEWDSENAQLEEIAERLTRQWETTKIVPLREALLPLLAKLANLRGDERRARDVLETIRMASDVYESIESREASAYALAELRLPQIVQSDLFARLLLRLVQDDDTTVREYASTIVTREWSDGFAQTERRCIESILRTAGPTKLRHTKEEIEAELALLSRPSSLLFAVEKSNIYQDDLVEPELYEVVTRDWVDSAEDLQATLEGLRKALQASPKPDGPLGLQGSHIVCKLAFRLEKSARGQQRLEGEDAELMVRLRACFL
ncbi:BQ5605_C024g09829 [Microbotryum silenes-dioicae]|uniref:BQ5605_C024g09829 protein n=1 Tax=Microbotryum silenes-dioicae TaxID=796604 RepID=A0A2X0NED8_9BASI|nr:BQ5605_C024g09829 [Microbotryum silenes-dioicae]